MPTIMHVVWNAYWLAMDMPYSMTAHKATAWMQQTFLTHANNSPMLEVLMNSMAAYSTLK